MSPRKEVINMTTTTPSVEGIKSLIKSWYDVQEASMGEGGFIIDTRESAGDDEPSQRDINEGKRILKLLRETYPDYKATADIVDEWVIIALKQRKEVL
jgi:hypothetical protein